MAQLVHLSCADCNRRALATAKCVADDTIRRSAKAAEGNTNAELTAEAQRAQRLKMPEITTRIASEAPAFEKNARAMIDRVTEIKNEEETIRQGGGAKAIEAQHKKGRLTARERIARLIDSKSEFFELGIYAGYEMYDMSLGARPASGKPPHESAWNRNASRCPGSVS